MSEHFYLYDENEETRTRFVSFMGESQRFDIAVLTTARYYGKQIIMDMQTNRFAIIGKDDLKEPGYIEYAFQLSEKDAEELKSFLEGIIL